MLLAGALQAPNSQFGFILPEQDDARKTGEHKGTAEHGYSQPSGLRRCDDNEAQKDCDWDTTEY